MFDINILTTSIDGIENEYNIAIMVLFINALYFYKNKLMFPFPYIGKSLLTKMILYVANSLVSILVIYFILIKLAGLEIIQKDFIAQAILIYPMIKMLNSGNIKDFTKILR